MCAPAPVKLLSTGMTQLNKIPPTLKKTAAPFFFVFFYTSKVETVLTLHDASSKSHMLMNFEGEEAPKLKPNSINASVPRGLSREDGGRTKEEHPGL